MYFDNRPCEVCGSEVRLREHGGPDHVVDPDGTIDERVCANEACATNQKDRAADAPTP